jgi:antitoxin component of MazEF toxin-antitoxin module
MLRLTRKVQMTGNSKCVIIPKIFVEGSGIEDMVTVELININGQNKIVISKLEDNEGDD